MTTVIAKVLAYAIQAIDALPNETKRKHDQAGLFVRKAKHLLW